MSVQGEVLYLQSLNKTHYKRRWLISLLVVTAWLFGGYMKNIHQIWLDTSENNLFSKSLLSTHFNNEDILSINSIGELRTVKVKPMILKERIQSTYSYIEEFDNTDYLDTTGTNASGWGRGSINLHLGGDQPIYVNTNTPALDVCVNKEYAFVAAESSGLAIINISDPTTPSQPVYMDTNGSAQGVFVRGDYVFIADGLCGLAIIDISDLMTPSQPIYKNLSDKSWDICVSGNYAFVTIGEPLPMVFPYAPELHNSKLAIIDINNPLAPGDPIYREISGSVQDIYVRDDYAFIACGFKGLAIIDISDPTAPGQPVYIDTRRPTRGIYVTDDYVFMAMDDPFLFDENYSEELFGLAIIDISDPTAPSQPIYQNTSTDAWGVHVSGNHAFVASGGAGLAFLDISNPMVPSYPMYRDTEGFAENVYVNDDYAFVATNSAGLAIIQLTLVSPETVQTKSIYRSEGFVQNVTLYANQTVYPNTSISHQISSDGNTWISITLNGTYLWERNPFHDLYWRAVLAAADQRAPSPCIDSIRIEFNVYYDEEPPSITLINVQNNTAIFPGTVIECSLSDYLLDKSWFNWNDGTDLPLTEPWVIRCPNSEGYHWLMLNVNDSVGHLITKYYYFYVNYPPLIELQSPLNNSVIGPITEIEFLISDPTLTNTWYQWDNQGKVSLTAPYVIKGLNSTGTHVLRVGACDSWNMITIKAFHFYIIDPTSIEVTQPRPFTAYNGERFIYSITITNTEIIPLNLVLLVFSPDDDVLTGNSSYFVLNPGKNITLELEIKPKHDSIHQLEICLFHEGLLFYHDILEFNVVPWWMSPTCLLPLLTVTIFLLSVVLVTGTSLLYIRDQLALRRLFWEQHTELIQLIDQLTISNLEVNISKETKESGSDDPSSRPLGFSQYLQLSEPLDREALKQQFYALRDQIVKGDPHNFQRLSELLTQAEELLKEFHEAPD